MLRSIAVSVCALALCVCGAVAAGLSPTATSLGAGTAVLAACDTDGVALTYQLNSAAQLSSVTVASIASSCAGGTARVTLTDGSTVLTSGSAALPNSGFMGKVVVGMNSSVAPSGVKNTLVAIDGV
jgi:imidazole glycerol phosphate synthase subunit HisF